MVLSLPVQLAVVLVLGIASQWIAWRLRWPAILVLLLAGIAAGPGAALIDPDALLGDLLLPFVSLSVAIILFEGGLSLRFRELHDATVLRLITIGAAVTWVLAAAAAYWIAGLPLSLAVLLGAILMVTGPTVILPLLRSMQLRGRMASILKWEGIVNDPIGAVAAVLVFEAILARPEQQESVLAIGLAKAVAAGVVFGAAGAVLLIPLLRKYWIPDYLQNSVALALVAGVFAASNAAQHESGLIAVTLMGIILANQRWADIETIVEFKENLRVLLISLLFILLAARIDLADLSALGLGSVLFIVVLIVVVRPASVLLATVGSGLSRAERIFVGAVAPRGVVAAAVASTFALQLAEHGNAQGEQLVPLMFAVIIGTIAFCGLTSLPLARALGVVESGVGYLVMGANPLAQRLGIAIKDAGARVLLVDTNWTRIRNARMAGLEAHHGDFLAEQLVDDVDLRGLGKVLALTANDEANGLGAMRLAKVFDSANVYQLAPGEKGKPGGTEGDVFHGRYLFQRGLTYDELLSRLYRGGIIKTSSLTDQFNFEAFRARYGPEAVPLFWVAESGEIQPFTADDEPKPAPGQKLISLVPAAATESDDDRSKGPDAPA